jgi:hypothetical protein
MDTPDELRAKILRLLQELEAFRNLDEVLVRLREQAALAERVAELERWRADMELLLGQPTRTQTRGPAG